LLSSCTRELGEPTRPVITSIEQEYCCDAQIEGLKTPWPSNCAGKEHNLLSTSPETVL